MRKINSWQNSTSIWWSNFFSTFIIFIEKNHFENAKSIFKDFQWISNGFSMKSSMKSCLSSSKISLRIPKNMFCVFKMFFFDEKIKVEKIFGWSYRCRILSGIVFLHSWNDLTTLLSSRKKFRFFCKVDFDPRESVSHLVTWPDIDFKT